MKFKKLSSLFLVMTIASSTILTGCSSKGQDSAVDSANDSKGTTELIWYMIGTPQPDQDKVMEEVNKYRSYIRFKNGRLGGLWSKDASYNFFWGTI